MCSKEWKERRALVQLSKYTNASCSTLQVNITIENVEMIVNNLTEIVAMTTEPADQNTDNIEIVREVMFETASLLNQALAEGKLELEVIQMVSCMRVDL